MNQEAQLLQIQPKLADRWWRLNNLYHIIDENGKRVLFKPNEVQKHIYDNLHYKSIILKSRQHGCTTLFCILMLDYVLFNANKEAAIATHRMPASKFIFRTKILYPFYEMPECLLKNPLFTPKKENETELLFPDHKGKDRGSITAQVGLRGSTNNWVHVCLAGNTGIYTKNGAVKNIKEIRHGDEVLTGNGTYQRVEKLVKHKYADVGQDLLEVATHGYYKPLKITNKHKVLTRGKRGETESMWKPAGELTLGDYIAMPIKGYSNTCKGGKLNMGGTKVKPTFDLGWLAGYYLAEGTTRVRGKIQSVTEVTYAVHTKEVRDLVQVLGKESHSFTRPRKGMMIRIRRHRNSKTSVVNVSARNFATWLNTTFGQGENKNIPDKVWRWGGEFLKGLIKGYIDGDGSYADPNTITLTSTRRQLIDQMRMLLITLRFGICTIYHKDAGVRYGRNCKECWTLMLMGAANWKYRTKFNLPLPKLTAKWKKWQIENGLTPSFKKRWRRGKNYYWAKITGIKLAEPENHVYDIVLKEDPHNYVTVNGVVHNSEYAKLCKEQPLKAKEIQTGTFETVHQGQLLSVESTAEGPQGDFFEKCKAAEKQYRNRTPLGPMDWKFFFFPWYKKKSNQTDPRFVQISKEDDLYFDKLEKKEGCVLSANQRAWYVAKHKEQGLLMTQEHPSTSDEAFYSSVKGAFWADEIRDLERRFPPQIAAVPHNPHQKVHTIHDPGYHWAIWFVQEPMEVYPKFINFFEFVGQGTEFCCEMLDQLRQTYGYRYGKHICPIDVDSNAHKQVSGMTILTTAKRNGYNFTKMTKIPRALDLIERARLGITNCFFDDVKCQDGINSLVSFRRKKDMLLSTEDKPQYLDQYVHDFSSHGASAFYHFFKARSAELFEDQDSETLSLEHIRNMNQKYARPR